MSYNLTKKQREDLIWVVEQIRAGNYDETFIVIWGDVGRINGGVPKDITLNHGTLDAWHSAHMIIAKDISYAYPSGYISHSTRCTITQLAYDAVDSNFIELEGQPNAARLQNFLSSNAFFKFEDLRDLATIIGLDHEAISGSTKPSYARELVLEAKRQGLLWDLVHKAFTIE